MKKLIAAFMFLSVCGLTFAAPKKREKQQHKT